MQEKERKKERKKTGAVFTTKAIMGRLSDRTRWKKKKERKKERKKIRKAVELSQRKQERVYHVKE